MRKFLVIVTADENDADYIEATSEINEKEFEQVKLVAEAMKERKKKLPFEPNFPTGDLTEEYGVPEEMYPDLDLDALMFFHDLCPYNEFGVHSVDKIEVREILPQAPIVLFES